MKTLIIGIIALFAVTAQAKGSSGPISAPAFRDKSPSDVRVLGELNVNTASPDQLRHLPGMDDTSLKAILSARAEGPVRSLVFLD